MQRMSDVNPYRSEKGFERKPAPANESVFQKISRICREGIPGTTLGWIALILGVMLVWQIAADYAVNPAKTAFPPIRADQYQAVYMSSGQVYFGHLKEINEKYAVLEDVHYIRAAEQGQASINVVRMVDDLYAPENAIYIPKEQVIFWQNIRKDSPLVGAILEAKNQ